jgi:hypothetical protein
VSDFCYGRPMLERIFRQAELMDRVMERIGVAPSTAARLDQGMAWYQARSRCIACCTDCECRAWLERPDPLPGPPPSCPNGDFFRRCLAAPQSKVHSVPRTSHREGATQ